MVSVDTETHHSRNLDVIWYTQWRAQELVNKQ
jgi:hypothetical protein